MSYLFTFVLIYFDSRVTIYILFVCVLRGTAELINLHKSQVLILFYIF